MENEPRTFDPRDLVGDIAYALWQRRTWWPSGKQDPYDHRHGAERYRLIAGAVADHLKLIGVTVTRKPPVRAHGSSDFIEKPKCRGKA